MSESTIAVSVVCNAYNHEPYIRSALEGFVMQKTTFPFEVLVHDDASTDNTADIIREYEKKYPEIIKPIYETENQYSKNDGSLHRIQYGRVRGRYIAMCEGDDYWTDPLKLQKQFDLLEANPHIDICATAAKTERDGQIVGQVAPAETNTFFTAEEVILGGGGFVATASLLYRKCIHENPLPFFLMMDLDFLLQINGALRGGMAYLADETCVYRLATVGSWTARMGKERMKFMQHRENVKKILLQLDEDTHGRYHDTIIKRNKISQFDSFLRERSYKAMCSPEYREQFRELSFAQKLLVRTGRWFPKAVNFVLDTRRRFR